MNTVQTNNYGFGEYQLERNEFFLFHLPQKVQNLFFSCLYGFALGVSIALIPIHGFVGVAASFGFSYLTLKSLVQVVATYYRAPSTTGLFSEANMAILPRLGEISDNSISGYATKDGVESHQLKLSLIRQALRNIFISCCYSGGRAFDEVLHLIQEKMRQRPNLTASILSSVMFISEENLARINQMEEEFGNRFQTALTPKFSPYQSPTTGELVFANHHTKVVVIDSGRAFMTGGSGIVSTWSEEKGAEPAVQKESHGFIYDHFLSMKAFRDMDFVFESSDPNGIGTRIYVEMMKLFSRFRYVEPIETQINRPPLDPPLLTRERNYDLQVACYVSGPENPTQDYLDEMIQQIRNTRRTIVIAHLYFVPPQELFDALIEARDRGVQITLITNKLGSKSPGSHMSYASLSRYFGKTLYNGQPNVEVYEFDVPYTSYNKKVMIFDEETVLLGSSNLANKSLSSKDYELNLKIISREFSTRISRCLQDDKALCIKVLDPLISFRTWFLSSLQTLTAPFL